MSFTRARRPEQKEERRLHLLATARAWLDEGGDLRDLSLNELARRAGMAKANIYRYFETREALLLALMWDEWIRWFEELSSTPERRESSLEATVSWLAGSLAAEPLLCALTAALPSVLEQNLSEEAIRTIKRESLELVAEVAAFLESRCSALPAERWGALMHDATIAIAGLWPSTHPAPAVGRVICDAPEFSFFRRDFAEELERFLGALAADHAASAKRPRRPRRR